MTKNRPTTVVRHLCSLLCIDHFPLHRSYSPAWPFWHSFPDFLATLNSSSSLSSPEDESYNLRATLFQFLFDTIAIKWSAYVASGIMDLIAIADMYADKIVISFIATMSSWPITITIDVINACHCVLS